MLPIVNADVGFSVAASFNKACEQDDPQAWKQELDQIAACNPVIAEFIYQWVKEAKGKCNKLHTLIGAVCVYKLLASQAEVDQMHAEIAL